MKSGVCLIQAVYRIMAGKERLYKGHYDKCAVGGLTPIYGTKEP